MTTQHTPTPWRVPQDMAYTIASAKDQTITSMRSGLDMSRQEAIANAAFIVTAVNAYERNQATIKALVEALDELLSSAEGLLSAGFYGDDSHETFRVSAPKAREALALAKGQAKP